MQPDDSALFHRLRHRQKQNARLYTRSFLPQWLSPVVSFLGLHFALISLVVTLGLAIPTWMSVGTDIVTWQKAVLFL